jgi:hypothetical protein
MISSGRRRALAVGLVLLGAAALLIPGPVPPAPCPTALVPFYISPADTLAWGRLVRSTRPGGLVTINPAGGPGTVADPAYVRAVARARAAGITVLGYVHTSRGGRPASDVKAEIDRYHRWYGVTSIFLDEAATSRDALSYYRTLARHVHANGGLVVVNPGVTPDQGYANLADVVVTFEGDAAAYAAAPAPPAWTATYPASRFGQLVYASTASNLGMVLSRAAARHASHLYVTDDALGNPWDTLASYYERESAALTSDCAA